MPKCALCGKEDELKENSHIIPKFVFEKIKKQSATGFMRNIENPDRRVQDGDKQPLLCEECEDLFSKYERIFARDLFHKFLDDGTTSFKYDNWLHYFITSVNWRTLYLDLVDFVRITELSIDEIESLINAERIMKDYLLSNRDDIREIENHIYFFDEINVADEEIANEGPHRFFRGSAFGYTFLNHDTKACYVYSNLAGIIICTIIKKHPDDEWQNTLVKKGNGEVVMPQYIRSIIIDEMFNYMFDCKKNEMSEKQQLKLVEQLKKNTERLLNSKTFEFYLMDKNIKKK